MTAQTAGKRLRAAGIPIVLLDGEAHVVRFDMAALVALEEQFGSLGAVQDLLTNLDEHKAVFGPMLDLLAAGLANEGMTRQRLLSEELVDAADLDAVATAVGKAFAQAFPDAAKKVASGEAEAATPTPPAPGTTGTTSGPSPSDDATPSSGA